MTIRERTSYHVVRAMIHNDQGQLLLAQRATDSNLGDHWELPGGKVDPGENATQALVREVQEELGVDIVAPWHVYDNHDTWKNLPMHIEIWKATLTDTSAQFVLNPREHGNVGWFDLDNLPAKLTDSAKLMTQFLMAKA